MARVRFTGELAQKFGEGELFIPANTIKDLIDQLSQRQPDTSVQLEQMAIAINGEIYQHALFEKLAEDTEVCFIPSINAG